MSNNLAVSAWQKKIAFYSASLLRQGNFVDAGFVSAILFEKIIENELRFNALEMQSNRDFISDAIDLLSRKDPRKYNSNNLHILRKIRDRHVINTDETVEMFPTRAERELVKAEIARFVTFVWQALDREKYIRYRTIGAIPLPDADNAILEAREFFHEDEVDVSWMSKQFIKNDFDDLVQLRLHFMHLAAYLKKHFLPDYNNLEFDAISRTDSASAYVLMSINLIRPGQERLRNHVHYASASIMATPLELRIYIDFGSEAYMSRADWFSFVETELFRKFVAHNTGLQIFDIEWYSYITDRFEAGNLAGSDDLANRIDEANKLLADCQEQRKVISWGRLLPGFIINRGCIGYDEICSRLENIVNLYYLFEKYRRDILKRKNTLDWVPKGI